MTVVPKTPEENIPNHRDLLQIVNLEFFLDQSGPFANIQDLKDYSKLIRKYEHISLDLNATIELVTRIVGTLKQESEEKLKAYVEDYSREIRSLNRDVKGKARMLRTIAHHRARYPYSQDQLEFGKSS